jgi:hypothetical protein
VLTAKTSRQGLQPAGLCGRSGERAKGPQDRGPFLAQWINYHDWRRIARLFDWPGGLFRLRRILCPGGAGGPRQRMGGSSFQKGRRPGVEGES